jgi:hypothetical protein
MARKIHSGWREQANPDTRAKVVLAKIKREDPRSIELGCYVPEAVLVLLDESNNYGTYCISHRV